MSAAAHWFSERLAATFIALRHRNYRLWFFGQLVSLVGTWMQSSAQGFLIYELTKSPAYLGYIGFLAGLPSWIFTLFAGVIADRLPRRNLLLVIQSFMMILAFILGGLTIAGIVQPWHILALAFLLGVANAFDAPTRLSFIREMVSREDLTNAIALNATMFTSAVVIGPAVGGLAYASLGPGWCFTLNGLSFLAVILALSLMKLHPFTPPEKKASIWKDLVEGVRYVKNHPVIRLLIINLGVIAMLGFGVITLLPAWSVEILGGDARTNGYLLSARGVGSLASALMVASLGRFAFRGKLWTIGSFTLPALTLLFALTRSLALALLIIVGIGWSFILLVNTTNAMVQSLARDELRGRVMGVYTLIFFGASPIGSLIVGWLAAGVGEPPTVILTAALLLAYAFFVFVRQPMMRTLE